MTAEVHAIDELPTTVSRKSSPSTGLSYILSGSLVKAPQKLYLCFHGWACSATDYAPLFSILASLDPASSRSILYVGVDLPGHGSSPKSICPHPTVPEFAALANDLRRELSPQDELLDTVLVGHSMGCRMALEACSQLHTNVSAVILLDGSWVGLKPEAHAAPVLEQRQKEIQRISDRIGMYGPSTPEAFKDGMERRLRRIDLHYEYKLSSEYIEWDRARMEGALEELGRCDGLKVLVVQSTQGRGADRRALTRGQEGPWLPLVREKVGSERFRSAVLEGCGHWPHVDKVEEVARIIIDFEDGLKNRTLN